MFYLKPKKINITVGNNYIVLLNEKTAIQLDLNPADRIYIKNGTEEVVAIVDISPIIKEGNIGLYNETWNKLKVSRKDRRVSVILARKPRSILYIKEKLEGKKLDRQKITTIVKDIIAEKTLSDVEMTYFVAGCYINGLNDEETASLAKAIVKTGKKLKIKDHKRIFDKHCIGGVPGNRTTLIIVPICAAAGLIVPKTSSRAITSPSGTADTLEVLTNITNNAQKLKRIIKKTGAFITWGGGVNLAGADDYLIRVRTPVSLDPESMMLASILAKKKAVSASHVLIDIPYGKNVKVKNKNEAEKLKKRFEKIGRLLKMKVKVVITDGKQPVGNGIGPILECIDVIKVLKNSPDAPKDLKNKSLKLTGTALELCGKARKGQGYRQAKEILESGAAYKKFDQIISAQGRKKVKLEPGRFRKVLKAPKQGKIKEINNTLIVRYAKIAGSPRDIGSGLVLHKKIGDRIKKGDPLITLYSGNKERLEKALKAVNIAACYKIR